MSWQQLKVVIWKNFIIRKRHWFLTGLEALLPITFYFLIAYGRSKITGLSKTIVSDPTYSDIEGIRYDIDVGNTYLLYTPRNDYIEDIISRIHIKLSLPSDQSLGFGSQADLLEYYYKNPNYTTAAIIFDDKDPIKLSYRLRYHEPNYYNEFLSTDRKYGNTYMFEPRTGGVYQGKAFLSIQLALDLSFIEQNLNVDKLNVAVLTQEFPYPPHKRDSYLTTLFLELLPLITLFSFIFICPAVLKRVVEEKHSGTKELMKMVGMKSWMLWLGWLIYGIIPIFIAVICIVFLMKIPFFGTDYPLIEHSDGGILFCFLILYCTASISFCFAISSFFSKPTIAVVTGILVWILTYFVPKYSLGLDESNQLPWFSNALLNLLPNMALHYGYSAVATFEEREIGVRWNNFYKSGSGSADDITMLNVYVMLIFDTFLFILFTFYMDGVNPGKYGVRKSFLFPFIELKKLLVRPNSTDVKVSSEMDFLKNVEEGHGLKKGIEIVNLGRRYGTKMAVDNLNLDIYRNQITVLLGHNGAGKSTTMSMITGMIEATSGSIRINNMDIRCNMDEIRQSLGLCPQHNLLFTDLTVKEHLIFFAKLKGKTACEADKESDDLLEKMNLADKKDSMANTLSGGMQRKLCLGMALVGGSKVLILDEPSSGMDPESRRSLWDILLKWRGEKTILITTHFMEEADALGDWIAIMANGALQCYGTPMYLKKKYETGYHLSLMINDSGDRTETMQKINSEVTKYIPDATQKSFDGNNIVFVLPLNIAKKMTNLLEYLENNKAGLKIENISVTVTTLEDVFLKTRTESADETDTTSLDTQALLDLKTSVSNEEVLKVKTFMTLLQKKWQFYMKKWKAYLIPILVALVFFCLAAYMSRPGDNATGMEPELKLTLSAYRQTSVFYNGTRDNEAANNMMRFYKNRTVAERSLPIHVEDVEQAILKKSTENIAYYKEHMVVGASFISDNTFVALYNAMALHSLPISINMITDTLAKTLLGPDASISITNWPLPSLKENVSRQELSEAKVAILWLIMIPIGCLFIHGSFIIFPFAEISTKFVRMQYMCGVKPITYWVVTFAADFIFYAILMGAMTLFLWGILPFKYTPVGFGKLFLIFILYGCAGIPFAYLFSRKKTVSSAFSLFIIMGLFSGIILTIIINILLESQDDFYIKIGTGIKWTCFLFIPQVGLSDALVSFARRSVAIYNNDVMPMKLVARCAGSDHACCVANSQLCNDFKNYAGVLEEHYLMLLCFVFYMSLNLILDTYFFMEVCAGVGGVVKMLRRRRNPKNNNKSADDSLEANGLKKRYRGKDIVKDINLTLNGGQCLGILGVNGAGKTTTFRMLTKEEVYDGGNIEIKIKHKDKAIDIGDHEYMERLGYCPQADFLNFVLTGREILTMIAKLRGVSDVDDAVEKFLKMFDLTKYANVPCGHYSGGNKRKLSLAISLIGFRKFVLLDEPTNGVDPSSRRKCWELIKFMQDKKDVSFILTSHSMTECEALCNYLKVMKAGKFVTEGSLAKLKSEHVGFSLKLKLRNKSTEDDVDQEGVDEIDGNYTSQDKFNTVEEIKDHFTKNGRGEVRDEHAGLLHLWIKERDKCWSRIFKEVEMIKASNPELIEDYAISEATLEDIFLQVARRDEDDEK